MKSDVNALDVICAVVIPIPNNIAARRIITCIDIPNVSFKKKIYQNKIIDKKIKQSPTIIVIFLPKY